LLLLCAQRHGAGSHQLAEMLDAMIAHALQFRERDATYQPGLCVLTTPLRAGLDGGPGPDNPGEQTRFLWFPWVIALTAQLLHPTLAPRAPEDRRRALKELL
jgi:hypothetical protein